jgi:hypothetical protein
MNYLRWLISVADVNRVADGFLRLLLTFSHRFFCRLRYRGSARSRQNTLLRAFHFDACVSARFTSATANANEQLGQLIARVSPAAALAGVK